VSQFWPLIKRVLISEVSGVVAKIGFSLKSTQSKFSLPYLTKHTVVLHKARHRLKTYNMRKSLIFIQIFNWQQHYYCKSVQKKPFAYQLSLSFMRISRKLYFYGWNLEFLGKFFFLFKIHWTISKSTLKISKSYILLKTEKIWNLWVWLSMQIHNDRIVTFISSLFLYSMFHQYGSG
jgi:hypothetical protein